MELSESVEKYHVCKWLAFMGAYGRLRVMGLRVNKLEVFPSVLEMPMKP